MAVYSVERYNFTTLYALSSAIGQDLIDAGFSPVANTVAGETIDAVGTGTKGTAGNPVSSVSKPSPTYGYGVASVTITVPGTKYDSANPPTVTISAPGNSNYAIIMTDAGYTRTYDGANYDTWQDPATGAIVDINNSTAATMIKQATGRAIVGSDGTITGVTITNPGYGYTQNETVTVKFEGGHMTTALLVLESTTKVDPLGLKLNAQGQALPDAQQTGTQPWRIKFDLRGEAVNPTRSGGILALILGTSATIKNDGSTGYVVDNPASTQPNKVEPIGNTGGQWNQYGGNPDQYNLDQGFLNRTGRSDANAALAFSMSYRLTVTNRGVFIGVWEGNAEELGRGFNWVLVQRSVDRLTGETRGATPATATGRCPVYCINSVNNKYYKFIVREADIFVPSERKTAETNDEDSAAVINSLNQQSLTESGEYVITFISNLNTSRYKYADELDMIGTVSADVVGARTDIEVNVYGETEPRTYTTLYPNGEYGTGMRLVVLTSNPNED